MPGSADGSHVHLPWKDGGALLDHVLTDAEAQGLAVAVALVDDAGILMGFRQIPGTFFSSAKIAIGKAFTAVNFRVPTHAMIERLPGDRQQQLAQADPRLVFIEGGAPIRRSGTLLGGLGVSGGTAAQDAALVKAALAEHGYDDED